MTCGLVILGASGRVGQMLCHLWRAGVLDFGPNPLWQYRVPAQTKQQDQALIWDILHQPPADLTPTGVICLAGGPTEAANADLAMAAVTFAKGAPVLFASTQAVYGPQTGCLHETDPCTPMGGYGTTKLAAERAIAAHPNTTSLRIGNVVGADMLSRKMAEGPVMLDQFPDGQAPHRMMIGPQSFGQACIDLLALEQRPKVVNLAQPGLVAMDAMLEAAEAAWSWQPAPEAALPVLEMDLGLVQSLISLPRAAPAALIAEARAAGWERST